MHINVQIGELSCYPQWQLCYKDLHWLPTLCDCTLGTGRSVEDGGVEMMYWQGEFISLEGLLQHWAQQALQPTISTIQSPPAPGLVHADVECRKTAVPGISSVRSAPADCPRT